MSILLVSFIYTQISVHNYVTYTYSFFFIQDCELLENDICRKEYAIAKRHPLIGKNLPMPSCSDLPPDIHNSDCVSLGVPQPQPVDPGNFFSN